MSHTAEFPGVGQPSPLLIHRLLDRPMAWSPEQRIIYRDLREFSYTQLHDRIRRLGQLLADLGVQPGDRVGVMDWDSHRYLEAFFAVPMSGAVLHTINVRLSPEQVLYTINHAGDTLLLVHPDFLPLVEQLAPRLTSVRQFLLLSDDGKAVDTSVPLTGEYETRLAALNGEFRFPEFDENQVATLFYTTGTTGDPKGVFFTHRQIVLHTLASSVALAAYPAPFSVRSDDVYLPLTPMFHVHAWGIPYIATLLSLKQVYPGRYEPTTLLHLLAKHRATLSHCVPTMLQMLFHHPAANAVDWSAWKVIIGGSALPRGLAHEARARGVQIMAGYGMSETCPVISVAHLKPEDAKLAPDAQVDILTRAGFPIPLAQAAVLDDQGQPQPPGRAHTGELVLRAPWLTPGYYRDEAQSAHLWRHGWLHTGDVAFLDDDGYINITDRLKDVIKIGGEWISSLELENALSQHPAVKEVAVVGLPDAKWNERPHAQVVLRPDRTTEISPKELLHFLHRFVDDGSMHKRAILTEISIVTQLPRTSVGKIDKRALRAQLASGT